MKKLTLLALVISFNVSATTTVTSVMNGAIDVGTFVSAAPGQFERQTSTGSLVGKTSVTGASVTSSINGAVSSNYAGTGAVYSSFVVNGLPSSAVAQGSVSTTVINHPLITTTIVPHHD